MPTIQSMDVPLPKDWKEFETMVRDAQAQRWKSTNLQKNGRPGQKQQGVDIYEPDDIGRPVGIQCKRYKGLLKLQDIAAEVANASKFKGPLTTLYIATTAEHDAKLQEKVRLLSDQRVAVGDFAVGLLYWDEIVSSLLLNREVFKNHYPQFHLPDDGETTKERLLAALELGYYGADLWAYIVLVFGQFGWLAQQDPDDLISDLRIVERRAQQLLAPSDAKPIMSAIKKIRECCLKPKTSTSDWDPVEQHAKRVSGRVQGATSLIPMAEANVLNIALQLGRIYHHADVVPALEVRKQVQEKVGAVLPASSAPLIRKKFVEAAKLKSGFKWAGRICSFLDHQLRFGK